MYNSGSRLFLLSLLFVIFGAQLKASHYSNGEIYYKWAPIATDSNRYEVFVNIYSNPSGLNIGGSPLNLCITSSCFSTFNLSLPQIIPGPGQASSLISNAWSVPEQLNCLDSSASSYRNMVRYHYQAVVSLPGTCQDFSFNASFPCCRDGALNLSTLPNLYLEATLNNTFGHSSSPQILDNPVRNLCLKQPGDLPTLISQRAVDPDGDSIFYKVVASQEGPACGPGTDIPFAPGYNLSQPIPSFIGWNIDQSTGVFRLSPSQQGDYILKIAVENYRRHSNGLTWVLIGNTVREVSVSVSAQCTSSSSDTVGLSFSSNTGSNLSFDSLQVDSLRSAYNVGSIANPAGSIAFLANHQCFDRFIKLDFSQSIRRNSIVPTDFRIIGPDSNLRPVIAVRDSSNDPLDVDAVYLELLQPLGRNGNYLLQVKNGNDGNTLFAECGGEIPEFASALISVSNCPKVEYRLNQVTLKDDYNLMVHWTAGPELSDSNVRSYFGAWNIYGRYDQGPWQLYGSLNDPLARRFEVDFGGSTTEVDQHQFEFQVELNYLGQAWGRTRSCNNVLLQELSVQNLAKEDIIQLAWSPYQCIPAAHRDYYVQYGRYQGNIHIQWEPPIYTQQHQASISIPKTKGTGRYAIRVYARHDKLLELPSESNWIMHDLELKPANVGQVQTSWIIPKILTPNGDGQNDRFIMIIPPQDAGVQIIKFRIYDRQGFLQYEDLDYLPDNNAQSAWDGSNQNGAALNTGTYFYIIEYLDPQDGVNKVLRGTLNLFR